MRAGHVLRPLCRIGHDVDVDARGVGVEQRAGLHDLVELLEHLLLDGDALEHRLDHDIASGDVVKALDRLDQRQPALHLRLGEAAAPHACLVVAADALQPAIQRVLTDFEDLHRKAELGKAHRDAAAHRAGADDRGGLGRPQRGVGRDVRQFGDLALGKESITQGARFGGIFQLVEQRTLARNALVERHRAGRLDRSNAVIGRLLVARAPGDRAAHRLEDAGIGRGFGELLVMVADTRQWPDVGDAARHRNRGLAQIAAFGNQFVDDAEPLGFLGRNVAARHDHLHRRLRADQPRQPLGAAAAGQDADQDLGQADPGARHGDAVVRGERHLQPAAQRIAVDRRDHRFRARVEHLVSALSRDGRRTARAELADVGAGDKAAAGADQHHRLDRRIGVAALDILDNALGHAGR